MMDKKIVFHLLDLLYFRSTTLVISKPILHSEVSQGKGILVYDRKLFPQTPTQRDVVILKTPQRRTQSQGNTISLNFNHYFNGHTTFTCNI